MLHVKYDIAILCTRYINVRVYCERVDRRPSIFLFIATSKIARIQKIRYPKFNSFRSIHEAQEHTQTGIIV